VAQQQLLLLNCQQAYLEAPIILELPVMMAAVVGVVQMLLRAWWTLLQRHSCPVCVCADACCRPGGRRVHSTQAQQTLLLLTPGHATASSKVQYAARQGLLDLRYASQTAR
jgi:type II secretory pathway component PulL